MTDKTPTLEDILVLASMLPSGLNDAQALDKLTAERDELVAALNDEDYVGALTEAADAVYYAAKHIEWVCHQVGVNLDNLMRVAAAKYSLRAVPGNPKDDAAERNAVVEALMCETLSYAGLGEEATCGRKAAYWFDRGKYHGFPICQDCAAEVHASRLTTIED